MKEFFSKEFYGNTITDWGFAFLLILVAFVIAKSVYWTFRNVLKKYTSKSETDLDDVLIELLEKPLVSVIVVWGVAFSLKTLEMKDGYIDLIDKTSKFIIIILATWFVVRITEILVDKFLKPMVEKTEGDFDDHLLPIISKGLKFIFWALGIIIALDNAGYDVKAVIAGFGIGGLAFALAAKDTISNLFGGVTILVDKPFKLGDRITVSGIDGTVKEIGIRSSRIQTLEGRIVTMQNSNFLKSPIENISSEPSRKIMMDIGLVYDTSYDKLKEAVEVLKEIAKNTGKVEEKIISAFNEFGDSSLDIKFIYYISKGEDIMGVKSEINFAIMKEFEERGLEMAYPTQTIITKKEN